MEAVARWNETSLGALIERALQFYVDYHEHNRLFLALWYGGRVSPAISEVVYERNAAAASQLRASRLASAVFVDEFTEKQALVAVEVGDRILDLAFRGRGRADRRTVAEGAAMITAYLERFVRDRAR